MPAINRSKYRPRADSDELSSIKRPWLLALLAALELAEPPPPPKAAWPCRSSWISSALSPSCVSGTALEVAMASCRARRYGASGTERATRGRGEVSKVARWIAMVSKSRMVEGTAMVIAVGENDRGRRIDYTTGRRGFGLRWKTRTVLCMNVRVTMASGPAKSMHRGSWSRGDDGSDVHDTAGWIESWRRASGLKPNPGVARFWRRPYPRIFVQSGACDWRIGIVGGKAVVASGRRLVDVVTFFKPQKPSNTVNSDGEQRR